MIRMFVRHSVRDYEAWKRAYDEFDRERRGMGVEGEAVFRGAEDTNDVTAWHDFESLETARSFVESARLREVMSDAGVVGQPQIWFAAPD